MVQTSSLKSELPTRNFNMNLRFWNKLNSRHATGFPQYLGKIEIHSDRKAIIMSDCPGETLKDILTERDPSKQITIYEFIEILVKILKLLQKIHKAGYVYCDLEPDTIFVAPTMQHNDDTAVKSHRMKMIEASMAYAPSSKTVRVKKESFTHIPEQLQLDRNLLKRSFEVSLLIFSERIHSCCISLLLRKYLMI